jgi:hypothetical protein
LWREVTERLERFGLKLHEGKTRLIEFGRFAQANRQQRGQSKPRTFDFLGFTHCCGQTRAGRYAVLRQTGAKRMRAKLKTVKEELRSRMRQSIPEQGRYLRSVVEGHTRYFGVPRNGTRIGQFRQAVGRLWYRTLRRRSHKHRLTVQRMKRLADHWLPVPHICHPYPSQRLIVTTQGKSRMR